ncbi:phosphatidylglycerophosphatase A [Sinimarinibacterium sp. NLF-5-8]|uniref:phosphatidylglycerophosphatase A family protein n=1 Tax=Sinimarinibacterium sp. NLF-5-8 TaxID=2698684 RepID=UPI00137BF351|nr:phosphatidylglycerophosphatase A [Sinimarinibacterium sp. NLF-5-8]QHS09890.1 phosphatidylglycerophosphatase A [Sinimarinibacterium sp. NLF-5-8]
MRATVTKPTAALILTTPEHFLAFGLGTGLAPFAPGTFGTLPGVALFLALMYLPLPWFAAAVALLFIFGCWLTGTSARLLRVHDHGGIVFDEIVGYQLAAAPLLLWPLPEGQGLCWGLLAAFALFRLFDVIKPWPISWLDRRIGGGLGIMLDDALAGALAGLLLWGGLWWLLRDALPAITP